MKNDKRQHERLKKPLKIMDAHNDKCNEKDEDDSVYSAEECRKMFKTLF